MADHPITAFISYSHDSDAHASKAKLLADTLRRAGLDAIIDQDLMPAGPSVGWPRWMQRSFNDATFVLCICSSTYRARIEGTEAPLKGRGVDWEGSLIYNLLYEAKSTTDK